MRNNQRMLRLSAHTQQRFEFLAIESDHQLTINERYRRRKHTQFLKLFQSRLVLGDVAVGELYSFFRKPRFLRVAKLSAGLRVHNHVLLVHVFLLSTFRIGAILVKTGTPEMITEIRMWIQGGREIIHIRLDPVPTYRVYIPAG